MNIMSGAAHGAVSKQASNATSSMDASFADWDTYKVRLLFKGWDVREPWQFALTWFVVLLAAMSLHYLDCAYLSMKSSMMQVLQQYSAKTAANIDDEDIVVLENPTGRVARSRRPVRWQITKLCMSLISGMRYAMTLFLMLTAMTYNPSLFLALVVGFFIGDFVCCDFHVNMRMGVDKTPGGGRAGPFICALLCIRRLDVDQQESMSTTDKNFDESKGIEI
jgi:Ctr copper transporter family